MSTHGHSESKRQGLRALSEATAVATASLDATDVERAASLALIRCFAAPRADLWLMRGGRLELVSSACDPGLDTLPPPNDLDVFARATLDRTHSMLTIEHLDEVDDGGEWAKLMVELGGTYLGVHPLTCNGRALGCFTVVHSELSAGTVDEIGLYAEQVGAALDKARLHQQATRSERMTRLQNQLLTELADCRDVASVAMIVHAHAREAAPSIRTTMMLSDESDRLLTVEPSDYAPGTIPSPRLASPAEHEFFSDLSETSETLELDGWGQTDEEEAFGIALHALGEPIGALVMQSHDVDDACAAESYLRLIATTVAIGLENATMFERANLRSERLAAAGEITRELASLTNTNRLFERLARGVCELGYSRVSVYDAEQELQAEHGEEPKVRATERELVASALGRRRLARFEGEHSTSWGIPIAHRGTVHAVLYAEHAESAMTAVYDDDQALLERVAEHAASALTVIAALEDIENSYVATVQALVSALEATDQYTHDHAQEVSMWAVEVGKQFGLAERDLRDLELAAIFHDIGKIAIPTEILNKPGKLTDEEFEIMKTHTIIGERIIAPIEFLKRVRPMVRHEHERWDGRGYPDGISGDEIPLGSRIIFVCDAYHAIISDRPYREKRSHEIARSILVENAGSQFDPAVVQAFLDVVERLRTNFGTSTPDIKATAQPHWSGEAGSLAA
jgi:HD-GYP domain-containing protein (c-di-GMP phosphodiesterase class II)